VIQAGVGFSDDVTGKTAARRAVEQARERLAPAEPRAALVFATAAWGPALFGLLASVEEELGDCPAYGATVAGLFGEGQGTADNPGLVIALLGGADVQAVLLEDLSPDDPESGPELLDHFAQPPGKGDLLLVLADLRHRSPDALLAGFSRRGVEAVIAGLGAAALPEEAPRIWAGGQVVRQGVLGVIVRGAASARYGIAKGCRPLSAPFVVSRVRDRWISGLSGESALGLLREAARHARLPETADSLRQLMVEVSAPQSAEEAGGGRLRNIVGIDPRRDAFLLPEDVAPGSRLCFAVRDAVAARENLESVVERLLVPGSGFALCASGSSLDYAGERGAARDARCFAAHNPSIPVVGLRGTQSFGTVSGTGEQLAALTDSTLLVVMDA
jgi:small ligand-binding sensory domain FIST